MVGERRSVGKLKAGSTNRTLDCAVLSSGRQQRQRSAATSQGCSNTPGPSTATNTALPIRERIAGRRGPRIGLDLLDLLPEEADGWDAGVGQHLFDGDLILSAIYFVRETTHQIDYVSRTGSATPATDPACFVNGARPFGYYDNTALTEADGVELAAAARLGALDIQANYTLTKTESRTAGANFGRELARCPKETAT
jgi:outer membrane receptor protein involved in Fe transport